MGFWQTGQPFTVLSSVTQQSNGLATINLPTVTVDKPNIVAHITSNGSLTQNFSVASFAQQPLGTAGNERRNQLFGPDLRRGDLSLFKTIPIHERLSLELRAECFNITNTPNFALPNRTITQYAGTSAGGGSVATAAGGFGTINSTLYNYNGRQFQFAGRFSF